jgi:hypothetical protein
MTLWNRPISDETSAGADGELLAMMVVVKEGQLRPVAVSVGE